ncbi:MAG TPA: 5'/3'-nucleotidase SurE [Planctomycetota bacterium]|nr:5'/3'-nucleotidase SurE [Planctomycetota bacterium]
MILLSNDDGIFALGLSALRDALRDVEDVTVVAPDMEQSGAAHSITLHLPLRVRRLQQKNEFFGFTVNGSPADCVKIAIRELMEQPPAAVLTGINYGANLGVNVFYSGTVAGALEGAMFGLPSFAFSLDHGENPDFDEAARMARQVYDFFKDKPLPRGTLLNVNIPALPADKIKGVAITRMSRAGYDEKFEKRYDPRGQVYYWISGRIDDTDNLPGTDVNAVRNGYVSVTPLHYDLTEYQIVEQLGGLGATLWETSTPA